jgi:hypothetical protein
MDSGPAAGEGWTPHPFLSPPHRSLFARIERWVEQASGEIHWRTITRDNVTSVFGKTRMGRVFDPRNPARVHEWLLEETWDGYGNHPGSSTPPTIPRFTPHPPTAVDCPTSSERRRMPAQRYPRRIHYGNFPEVMVDANGNPLTYPDGQPVGPLRNGRRYAFEVVFDYGDWDPTADLPNPQRPPRIKPNCSANWRRVGRRHAPAAGSLFQLAGRLRDPDPASLRTGADDPPFRRAGRPHPRALHRFHLPGRSRHPSVPPDRGHGDGA